MLEIERLGIQFGGLRAVHGLDLRVGEREIVGLIGPNGAGKTTVFNCVTGIYPPTSGDIRLGGRTLVGLVPHAVFAPFLRAFEEAGNEPSDMADVPPMPEFQPPQDSPVLSYLVSFGIALLFLVVMWGLYQGWKRYAALNTKKPLDEIARIARSSIQDLSSGHDSSDVIINCYLRMSDIVADKPRLRREIAMTPQEFAVRLEKAGQPGDAVRRLTSLFETVRYGDRKSAPRDVTEAVSCLNAILRSCGESV